MKLTVEDTEQYLSMLGVYAHDRSSFNGRFMELINAVYNVSKERNKTWLKHTEEYKKSLVVLCLNTVLQERKNPLWKEKPSVVMYLTEYLIVKLDEQAERGGDIR